MYLISTIVAFLTPHGAENMSNRATEQTAEILHMTQIEKQGQVSAEQVRFIY